MTDHKKLILASGSPRRRELIKLLDVEAEITGSGGDEEPPLKDESPSDYVIKLSLEKARFAAKGANSAIVLGADTSVVLGNEILGKPEDDAEAFEMLYKLRGQTHAVVTGFTLLDADSGEWKSGYRSSDVVLRNYSDTEIKAYVDSGEPMDKAGAYAAQDPVFKPASAIIGCYLNVVGLPLCDVTRVLGTMGMSVNVKKGWHPPEECQDCPFKVAREEKSS